MSRARTIGGILEHTHLLPADHPLAISLMNEGQKYHEAAKQTHTRTDSVPLTSAKPAPCWSS